MTMKILSELPSVQNKMDHICESLSRWRAAIFAQQHHPDAAFSIYILLEESSSQEDIIRAYIAAVLWLESEFHLVSGETCGEKVWKNATTVLRSAKDIAFFTSAFFVLFIFHSPDIMC
eukprot:gene5325-7096_t